jgi:hypothetical protein
MRFFAYVLSEFSNKKIQTVFPKNWLDLFLRRYGWLTDKTFRLAVETAATKTKSS